MKTQIKRCTNERGASFRRPLWEGYVNDRLVVFHARRWLVVEVVAAVATGAIPADGDTIAWYTIWAANNAPDVYARIVATQVDGLT